MAFALQTPSNEFSNLLRYLWSILNSLTTFPSLYPRKSWYRTHLPSDLNYEIYRAVATSELRMCSLVNFGLFARTYPFPTVQPNLLLFHKSFNTFNVFERIPREFSILENSYRSFYLPMLPSSSSFSPSQNPLTSYLKVQTYKEKSK